MADTGGACSHCHTACAQTNTATQSMDELNFERGIWQAAIDNDYRRVKRLLDKGVPADLVDSSGYTALHYASRCGHIEIIRLLFEFGAKPNAQTRSGKDCPMHRAAYQGHEAVVKFLLLKGADPLMQNADGQTALHKAFVKNNQGVISLLLKENPSLKDVRDNKGKTPADYMTMY